MAARLFSRAFSRAVTERIGFKMYLNEGQLVEYKKRHDAIPSQWPELKQLLTDTGIRDYTIFFDEETSCLFATLHRLPGHTMDALPNSAVMQKWWQYMAPLMRTDSSHVPVSSPLKEVFHMD